MPANVLDTAVHTIGYKVFFDPVECIFFMGKLLQL